MEYKDLGSLCEIVSGGTPSRANAEFWDGGTIPWIKISDIKSKYISQSDEYITQAGLDGSSAKMVPAGSILYTIFATLGEVGILTFDACTNQAIAALTIKDLHDVITDYLYYYLKEKKEYINNLGRGVAQNNINLSILRGLKIPIIATEQQQKIVAILIKCESLMKLYKQQLAKLNEIVQARFIEMFGDCKTNPKGWKTRQLEDISEVGSSKRVFVEDLLDEGIPFYRGTEIGALAERKSIIPELFISSEHYGELCEATGAPQIGDLLMPSICPDGRIWIVDTSEPFYFKDGRVLWVHHIDRQFNPVFLLYTLKDRITADYSNIASGTTFAELKIFALKKCRVFDVPIALQNQFAAFVTQVEKSKAAVQSALDKVQLLFDSLMQKYFG